MIKGENTRHNHLMVLAFVAALLLTGCSKQNNETQPVKNSEIPPAQGNQMGTTAAQQSLPSNFADACALPERSSPTGLLIGGAIQCVSSGIAARAPEKRTGSFAKFAQPSAITTDGRNLYVVDNDRIRKVSIATGEVSTLTKLRDATNHTAAPAAHGFPGITTDGYLLYVADQEHNEIRKVVIANGELTTLTSFNDYIALQDITFDGRNIYALAVNGIYKIDPATGKAAQWKSNEGPASIIRPIRITNDGKYLYLLYLGDSSPANFSAPEIRKIEIDTGRVSAVAAVWQSTWGDARITTDGYRIYITDPNERYVYQVDIASGKLEVVAGYAKSVDSADGTGDEATLLKPTGITSDGRNLYVSDSQSARIRKIEISSHLVTTMSGSTPGNSEDGVGLNGFDLPVEGMTSDGKYLYVTDPSNSSIRRIELATNMVSTLVRGIPISEEPQGSGAGERHLNHPRGLKVEAGSLYIADYNNHAIRKVEIATGKMTTLAGANVQGAQDGTGSAASFNYPYGIASDGANLYIADYNNHAIRQVEIATGKVKTLAGSGEEGSKDGVGKAATFAYPRGLAFDTGVLYVADYANNVIRQVEISTGKVKLLAGSGQPGFMDGIGKGVMFRQPSDIVADAGKLYVADTYNNVIRQIEIGTGKVTTLAGSGNEGNVDGTGMAASFDRPLALAISGRKLYVADSECHIIRSIDLATGAVETLELKGAP